MRYRTLAALAMGVAVPAALGAQQRAPCTGEACLAVQNVFFGTRAGGPGNGIVAARFDPRTGTLTGRGLVAEIERPTWIMPSPHRSVLYSVSEVGNDGKTQASVYSFAVPPDTGTLTQISKVPSGGGGATYLSLGGMPPAILVANYGSGTAVTIPLGRGGTLSPPSSVRSDVGSGPHPRQKRRIRTR